MEHIELMGYTLVISFVCIVLYAAYINDDDDDDEGGFR